MHLSPGPQVRRAPARQDPGVHRDRRAVAGAGHRREHHDFHAGQRRPAESAAGRRPVAARVGLDHRRAQPGRPALRLPADLADELRGPARQERGVFRDDRPRRDSAEHHRTAPASRSRSSARSSPATTSRCSARGPQIGRGFLADEDRTPGEKLVTVLGYGEWQKRYGGDPSIVGRTINLNGAAVHRRRRDAEGIQGHERDRRAGAVGAVHDLPADDHRLLPRAGEAGQPPRPGVQHHRAAQARRLGAAGRSEPEDDRASARAGIPERQQGAQRHAGAAGAGDDQSRLPRQHREGRRPADDDRRPRAADRVRERREPAAGARGGAAEGDRRPPVARRGARPADHAAADGRDAARAVSAARPGCCSRTGRRACSGRSVRRSLPPTRSTCSPTCGC